MKTKFLIAGILMLSAPARAQDASYWGSSSQNSDGCNQQIAQAIQQMQNAQIAGQTQQAQSLYDAVINNLKYKTASCLQSMIPSTSFGSGGIDLSGMIGSMACQYVDKLAQPVVSDISGSIQQAEGSVSQSMQIPGINGLNLGVVGPQISTGSVLPTSEFRNLYSQNFPQSNYGNINPTQVLGTSVNWLIDH